MGKYASGSKKYAERIDKMLAETTRALESELARSAETVRTNVVADIRRLNLPADAEMPTGGPGRDNHLASPGHGPPNTDTGRLMDSYTTSPGSFSRTHLFNRIVAGVTYAFWLEFGTSKMLPRPHLLPRFREEGREFTKRLRARFGKAVAAASPRQP